MSDGTLDKDSSGHDTVLSRCQRELLVMALCQFRIPGMVYDSEGWTSLSTMCRACGLPPDLLHGLAAQSTSDSLELQFKEEGCVTLVRSGKRTKPVPDSMLVDLRHDSPAYIHPASVSPGPTFSDDLGSFYGLEDGTVRHAEDNEAADLSSQSVALRLSVLEARVQRLHSWLGPLPMATSLCSVDVALDHDVYALSGSHAPVLLRQGQFLRLRHEVSSGWRCAVVLDTGTLVWVHCN